MTSVAWVPPFFFNGATQATTLVVWVAPFFFLLFSLGLLFRSVFQHLYWGRSPAAACVTLCCREGLALFPPFCFKGLKVPNHTLYFTTSGEQPCRRVCDTLPVAWVFPHFALKGGFKFRCKTLYGGARVTDTLCCGRRLGFPTPIFALRAFYYAAFLRHFEKALE